MSEIPATEKAIISAVLESVSFRDFTAPNIAYAAILAERKRCADAARGVEGRWRAVGHPDVELIIEEVTDAIEATP